MTTIYQLPREEGISFSQSLKFFPETRQYGLWLTKSKMKNNSLRYAVQINYSGEQKQTEMEEDIGPSLGSTEKSCLFLLAQ